MSKSVTEKKQEPIQAETSPISVCDVFKDNTTAVIEKLESQVPIYLQLYSDLYTEYLHSVDKIFGTCYISQKEFFDKIGIDQGVLRAYSDFWSTVIDTYNTQIDMFMTTQKTYVKTRIEAIKYFNQNAQLMMDNYAKMLSQFNKKFGTK
ncbi:hypothetical protein [Candidatus Nitrosotenuis uzonensis]|uniref:Uncharacterized protein n=1 Tax=Candidatus Nitrosotenuis uzonensis TaxID=1407055 RepID=A0A812EXY0_9ARCH|nr:hypothetical protein [Candidatus Nitrosotenuis uzonensis]CAE6500936.1 conserved hypothetical protein [Candidatus Nitrosotenuis uzonensis]